MHISQPLTKQAMKTSSPWDVERSGSTVVFMIMFQVIRWDSTRKCFLHNGLETGVMHRRDRRPLTYTKSISGCSRKKLTTAPVILAAVIMLRMLTWATKMNFNYVILNTRKWHWKSLFRSRVLDSELCIYSPALQTCNEGNDPENENNGGPKLEQLKREQLEWDLPFFLCTRCNINLKEKRHFHRHMMYHLDKHNQMKNGNVSMAFICRDRGCLFCDSNSLMRNIIIHKDHEELPPKTSKTGKTLSKQNSTLSLDV